jgi:S1-C subfamily serine protease
VSRSAATAILTAAVAFAALLAIAPARATLTEAIERVRPAVVAVGTYQKTRSPPFVFRGTGFAVGNGTLVATAAHAVSETLQTEPPEIMTVLVDVPGASEPQPREARPVAVDRVHDVALLRIGGAPLPAVKLGDSDAVRDGTAIAFTGFPIGNALGFNPVTHRGIVSSHPPLALPSPNAKQLDVRVIRSVKDGSFPVFQLDATAYPGHSGSPLYDAETGDVVGVVNMAVKATKEAAVGQATGISFAVPIKYVQELLRGVR